MDIREALAQLDPLDDSQWTSNGDPRVDVVESLIGEDVSRQQIVDAAPNFNRENPQLEEQNPEPEQEPEQEPEPVDEEEIVSHLQDLADDEPLTPNKFAAYLKEFPTEGLGDLEKFLREQRQVTQETISRAEEMDRRVKIALSMTQSRIKREVPDMSNQEAIRSYLNAQREERAARADAAREILKGIDLSELDPRAAIDKAMARKTGRGGKRPVRPQKVL